MAGIESQSLPIWKNDASLTAGRFPIIDRNQSGTLDRSELLKDCSPQGGAHLASCHLSEHVTEIAKMAAEQHPKSWAPNRSTDTLDTLLSDKHSDKAGVSLGDLQIMQTAASHESINKSVNDLQKNDPKANEKMSLALTRDAAAVGIGLLETGTGIGAVIGIPTAIKGFENGVRDVAAAIEGNRTPQQNTFRQMMLERQKMMSSWKMPD